MLCVQIPASAAFALVGLNVTYAALRREYDRVMFWLKLPPVAEIGHIACDQRRSDQRRKGMLSGVPAARAFDTDSTMPLSRISRSALISQSDNSKLVDNTWSVLSGVF